MRVWRRGDVLRQPVFYLLFLGVLCPPFMSTAFFFHQLHLLEITGWPKAYYALGLTAFALAQLSGSLVAGAGIDRWSARAMLPLYLVPMGFGLMLVFWLSAVGGLAGYGRVVAGAFRDEISGRNSCIGVFNFSLCNCSISFFDRMPYRSGRRLPIAAFCDGALHICRESGHVVITKCVEEGIKRGKYKLGR